MKQQEQRNQTRDGEGETRLGKFEFESDYVTEETAAKLREELRFQAAVQTYLWAFGLANVFSLREGHRAVGINNTTIPIFEDFLTPKSVVPTGNQSTIYAYNVTTLHEPMVLVVPPDVVGFAADAWQRPQGDLGRPGADRGKGGKYLVVPPGYEGDIPSEGYYVIHCATKNLFWLIRGFIKDGDTQATVQALKETKIYPLSNPNAQQEYLNGSTRPAYCIPPRGYAFWELLAKALNEETVQVHLRGKGSKYILTSRDSEGNHLDGSHSYKLNVPANVPAQDFWSVCVYDTETRSILDTGRPLSAVNSYMDVPINEDGTIDLHFGPEAPPQGESGWIKTKPGKGFFMYFRFYGPLEPFYDKSWKINDVVKVA